MRIYLKLTKNTELIPFNYQPFLTGALHKWIGADNIEHGKVSLYSFSWLQNVDTTKEGLNTKNGSFFFISAHNDSMIKPIIEAIRQDPAVCFGVKVSEILIRENPNFESPHRFEIASPIFVRKFKDEKDYHITYDEKESAKYLTEIMQKKLSIAGLSDEGVEIRFDDSYTLAKTKVIKYKNIGNKVNVCPIIAKGTPEQLAFIWNVGVGNSTGIGFGAVR